MTPTVTPSVEMNEMTDMNARFRLAAVSEGVVKLEGDVISSLAVFERHQRGCCVGTPLPTCLTAAVTLFHQREQNHVFIDDCSSAA
jgi:hypothetical protein